MAVIVPEYTEYIYGNVQRCEFYMRSQQHTLYCESSHDITWWWTDMENALLDIYTQNKVQIENEYILFAFGFISGWFL